MGLKLFSIAEPPIYNRGWAVTRSSYLFWAGFITVTVVYLATLAPTVFTLDSAEFAAAAYVLGIVHSPGYVVYLLIAKLMTYLPVGDIAFRVNLLSAIFALLSYVTFYRLTRRLTGEAAIATAAGLTLSFSYYVWAAAVIAEVYTMQMWLFALILTLCLDWEASGSPKTLYLLAFVSGIALANNPTTVLWWAGIAWFLFRNAKSLTPARLTLAITIGLASLSPLLYLPIRSAAQPAFVNVGAYNDRGQFIPLDLTTFENLRWYLTGQEFDSFFFAYDIFGVALESGIFLYQLMAAFLGIGLPLGIIGIGSLWQKNRPLLCGVTLLAAPHLIFFINYNVVDKATMFLPVYLIWVLLMAFGYQSLAGRANDPHRPARRSNWRTAAPFLLPALLLLLNWQLVDTSEAHQFAEEGQLRLTLAEQDALFIARWGRRPS